MKHGFLRVSTARPETPAAADTQCQPKTGFEQHIDKYMFSATTVRHAATFSAPTAPSMSARVGADGAPRGGFQTRAIAIRKGRTRRKRPATAPKLLAFGMARATISEHRRKIRPVREPVSASSKDAL
jgi:hypothetical protein